MGKRSPLSRSAYSVAKNPSGKTLPPLEIEIPPLDTLNIEVQSLRVHDEPRDYAVKVSYSDQLLMHGTIVAIRSREPEQIGTAINGSMQFDPSDYEKMCMLADNPLVVTISPIQYEMSPEYMQEESQSQEVVNESSSALARLLSRNKPDISCCNVDILPILLREGDTTKMKIKKRMEPLHKPSVLQCKSWDCLPQLTMEISVTRDKENAQHHKVLKDPNWMKLTLIGAYNLIIPFDPGFVYTAASKIAVKSETNTAIVTFNQGTSVPKNFKPTNVYSQWGALVEESFTKSDENVKCKLEDIQNEYDICLDYYINRKDQNNTVVFNAFHRSLMVQSTEKWFAAQIKRYKWPLEVHVYAEDGGFSFMTFLNLFDLLIPGVDTVRMAVPLRWVSASLMRQECNCELLLAANDKAPSSSVTVSGHPAAHRSSSGPYANESIMLTTGGDDSDAFVIVEVRLARPLREVVVPKPLLINDLNIMLKELEEAGPVKRRCKGRGQLVRDWQSTIRLAASSLRRVPYYGAITEFCTFNRQLSETRTRVELTTSFCQDAATYVNNNFVVQQYLHSDEMFQEMIMMAHACLMKSVRNTLIHREKQSPVDVVLIAARHARQMQDTHHAMELYMQVITENPNRANIWRELSTCLKDMDVNWAEVCLNRSLMMEPRHPLTLISKGGMMFEKDPRGAELFFMALLAFYPFWNTAWVIVSAYYYDQQYFILADKILEIIKRSRHGVGPVTEELSYTRQWEFELGDWWDAAPRSPGTNIFYDAADLLLRMRCIALAEVCLSRALAITGEMTCIYYHLVALCYRLRGEYEQALCLLRIAIEKFGEVYYLRSLEGECYHKLENIPASMDSYRKIGGFGSPYTVLMSLAVHDDPQRVRAILEDVIRTKPCAYTWMALANDWMKKAQGRQLGGRDSKKHLDELSTVKSCAAAAAEQALKWDRRAGAAWALLADVVKPSARRYYCANMAALCNNKIKPRLETDAPSQQSLSYRLGVAITECSCPMCEGLQI